MLSAIRDIGKWQREKTGKDDLAALIKNPNFKNGGELAFVKIDIGHQTFEGVELEDYDPSKSQNYLFRDGVTNGPNPMPIAKILNAKKGKSDKESLKNLEVQLLKTFNGKILKWFGKYSTQISLTKEDRIFFEKISDTLDSNKDQIIQEIKNSIVDIPKKKGKLLSVKIKQGREWKYIGDFEVFRKSLKDIESDKFVGISASNKICSICGNKKSLVSGDASVYKFYTIDKPGFIAGGFKEQDAWKNFPICSECKPALEEGRKFIEGNLAYKFYGMRYFLIPKLLLRGIGIKTEVLDIMSNTGKTIALKDRVKKRLTDDENEILELLAAENDVLTLSLLFMSKEQSAERILLLIEDVFPSRIRRIFEAKDSVDKVMNESFTFGKIRDFFAKSDDNKKDYDLNKYFLNIIDNVFRGVSIDLSFLVKFYMHRIRKELLIDGFFNLTIKNALMSTLFFENLGLINFVEAKKMEKNIFDEVISRYGKSLNTPGKRGVFLLGALTQLLINKQWADRQAKPFIKNLKALKMDVRDIKALLPKVQNKLEEYESFDKGKKVIASEVSSQFLEAGDDWDMPVDEMNYYFACGMNLAENIAVIVYAK